jgi:hypothetical protein
MGLCRVNHPRERLGGQILVMSGGKTPGTGDGVPLQAQARGSAPYYLRERSVKAPAPERLRAAIVEDQTAVRAQEGVKLPAQGRSQENRQCGIDRVEAMSMADDFSTTIEVERSLLSAGGRRPGGQQHGQKSKAPRAHFGDPRKRIDRRKRLARECRWWLIHLGGWWQRSGNAHQKLRSRGLGVLRCWGPD